MNHLVRSAVSLSVAVAAVTSAQAQHLIWHAKPGRYTAIYGEITVLQTNKSIYYCGCNWWPGNPAGGYTGIQDPGGGRHNMIFSIWDTADKLHPSVTEAESRTQFNRFGGEGTGAHTHLDYSWTLGKTYRYYVTKEPNADKTQTLTRLYFLDDGLKKWVHEATISNPNDGHESVETFGGMLNAFLENWSGEEREKPKLALYRLWVGTKPDDLTNVTEASGDGSWGVINNTFYLAEGAEDQLNPVISAALGKKGIHVPGIDRKNPLTVTETKIPGSVLRALKKLPRSPKVSS